MLKINAQFPEKCLFLINEKARYKGLYGGRGGMKSWSAARALVLHGVQRNERILCVRETQKSIADSVHQLLSDQIAALNLGVHYQIEKARIRGPHGTYFTFGALRNDPDAIKSIEGATKVWVEEANGVSKRSWDILIPTVRRPESEIWLTWNPELDTDETHRRFILNPPPDAIIRKVNYLDNPWCPDVIVKEADYLKSINRREYENIYLGLCRSAVEGAIYEGELAQAELDGRITRVPYDKSKPVDTYWDLGFGDGVAIWFVQHFAFEHRFIDYEFDQSKAIPHYVQLMQSKGYIYGTDYLPWDGGKTDLATGKSIQQVLVGFGRKASALPQGSVHIGINEGRTVFSSCWFDSVNCADGLQALRHYAYGKKIDGEPTREPIHNWACFHPDTRVLTRSGTYRITDLPKTDCEVLTLCGWKRYEGPKVTKRNAPLVEVAFEDGFTVKCTPEHKWLTESGWRSAESLTPNTVIQSGLMNPPVIAGVRRLQEKSDVWCIHVEDGGHFALENGAIVSNSHGADGFRTFAMRAKAPKAPVVQQQKRYVTGAWG